MAFSVFLDSSLVHACVHPYGGIHYISERMVGTRLRIVFSCDGTDCSLLSVAYTSGGLGHLLPLAVSLHLLFLCRHILDYDDGTFFI